MRSFFTLLAIAASAVAVQQLLTQAVNPDEAFQADSVGAQLWSMADLPITEGVDHMGSGNCVLCHGPDPVAMQDAEGGDVNVIRDWSGTMMANSAKDPFWRSKVAHEQLVNPEYAAEIANVCTGCHAPAGHHEALLAGAEHYTIDELVDDPLGLDGVNCTACHTMSDDNLASRFNGDLPTNSDRIIYGPFEPQVTMPMQNNVNYTPTEGSHFLTSNVCAPCHSLYTHTFDLEGQPTGGVFFEQSTFKEWANSSYAADDITCQACHMPLLAEQTILSDRPPWLEPNRYGQHHLIGGNKVMLSILRDNAELLELPAYPAAFDSSIARTERILTRHTANLNLTPLATAEPGVVEFEVEVENLAGHKYPGGYPSRIAFLEFVLTDPDGNELFRSGGWSPEEGVWGRDGNENPLIFEPHHQVISSQDQVQVYEMVFADVAGQPTTVLDRAASILKDNRLPPLGFDPEHVSYDTTRFGPAAEADPDFNFTPDGTPGSGTDRLTYAIDLGDYTGDYTVSLKLHHLTLPMAWAQPMFDLLAATEPTAENADQLAAIELFEGMFNAADRTPVVVAEVVWHSDPSMGFFDEAPSPTEWKLVPNPATDQVHLEGPANQTLAAIDLLTSEGQQVAHYEGTRLVSRTLSLSDTPVGTYLVQLHLTTGETRVLRGLKVM
jgi:hypothetical protein